MRVRSLSVSDLSVKRGRRPAHRRCGRLNRLASTARPERGTVDRGARGRSERGSTDHHFTLHRVTQSPEADRPQPPRHCTRFAAVGSGERNPASMLPLPAVRCRLLVRAAPGRRCFSVSPACGIRPHQTPLVGPWWPAPGVVGSADG